MSFRRERCCDRGRGGDPRRPRAVAPTVPQAPRALSARARLRVRADAGFADATLLAFLDAAEVEYVLGLAGNRRLDKRVRRLLGRARMQARTTGETATLYGETRYAARRWDRKRRIIMKAEVLCYPGRARKDNPRFLVTNLPHRPATVYTRLYCGRGDMENRLKELQQGLAMDRTSCSPAVLRRGLRAVPGAAGIRARQRPRRGSDRDAARAAREDRRLGRTLHAPHRAALATGLPVARHLARPRPCADCHLIPGSTTVLAQGRGIFPAGATNSRAQSSGSVAGDTLTLTPPRAIVSARERSTRGSLEPSRPLVSAFTNSPG